MNFHKKLSRLIAFAALLCSGWLFAQNASVTNAEYFWNTDPGEGNATAVQVSDGNFDEVIESLVGSNVMVPSTEGYHVLYVRARDINNAWGKSFAVVVRVNGTSISLRDANLAQAEYFWDTDPGEGNANALYASDGDMDEILETLTANNINTPSTLGPHVLYVRTKDAQNGWGRCFGKVVTVRSIAQARNAQLVNAEFFFDTDPGVGNGNPLSVFDGNFDEIIETLSGNKLVTEVDSGIHTLYVRTKDADNNWGPAFGKVVHIDSSYTNYQLNTTIE
ncbi:MAG: hypothetical protein MI922_26715, partial [Bacteroidales bacterium]|nr:hypothetical protein [Bacteroidales bacterium]